MKLYTEEEVIKLLDKYTVLTKIGVEFYLNKMTPIELPSDDEIIEVYDSGIDRDTDWIAGALWMRDKIQGGNK